MYDYQTLSVAKADRIATLTLNRPDQMNAFTVEMSQELVDFFTRVNDDTEVGAIIVTGAGKAFCAGMDLSTGGNVFGLAEHQEPTLEDMRERRDDPEIYRGVRDTGGLVTLSIFNCTKPVIAAMNGAAVGIGATMTLAMDFRIASSKARIGFVFGRIGIVPEACSSWFLPRIVGIQKALEWCYTADILDAQTALDGGLLKSVHEPDRLMDEARTFALSLISNRSAVAVALTRQMLYRNSAQPHPFNAHEIDSLAVFYTSRKDGREGVQAFLDKREADFTAQVPDDLPPFYKDWAK